MRRAADRIASHVEPASRGAFESYGNYFVRFEDAPLVIVPLYRPLTLLSNLVADDLAPAEQGAIDRMERDSALISTSLAVQNLLLMATALGLGASLMTGPLIAGDELGETLGLRPSWQPLAVLPLGYMAENPAPTTRKEVAKVTRFIAPKEPVE